MGWTTLDIRKDLKYLEKILESETNPKKRDRIITYIANMKYEIACTELTKFEKDEDEEEKALNDIDLDLDEGTCFGDLTHNIADLEKYRLYYPFIKKHIDICDKDLERDYVFSHHGNLKLSKKEIFDAVHEFYKGTNKYFYNKYLLFEKNKNKILNYRPELDSDDGTCLSFPLVKSRYLEVGGDGAVQNTLVSLSHEIGHFIGSIINEERYFDDDKFVEIESLFFELISNDYFYKTFDNNKFKENLIDYAYTYHDDARNIMAFKKVNDDTFKKLYKLDNPYHYYGEISKKVPYYKNVDVDDKMKYLFSYLVALELYELYKEDKDLALYKLKEIVRPNNRKSEYQRITENIELNNNMKEHVKTLKRF